MTLKGGPGGRPGTGPVRPVPVALNRDRSRIRSRILLTWGFVGVARAGRLPAVEACPRVWVCAGQRCGPVGHVSGSCRPGPGTYVP